MTTIMYEKVHGLLQQSKQSPCIRITEAELAQVPEAIQRYLSYAHIVGKETIQTVHLKQKGWMQLRPDRGWLPMTAEQYCTMEPPAFVWHGVVQPFPFVSIEAWDHFTDGHGNLLVKLLSIITLANARGLE